MHKSDNKYFRVRNFEKYQHYPDRAIKWLKLHCSILEDDMYSCLSDGARSHLVGVLVLAARTDNCMIYDALWVKRMINARSPVRLDLLLDSQFIEMIDKKF